MKDIFSNTASGTGTIFGTAIVNGTLLFTARDGTSGLELWKTDGTTTGTVRLTDINPGAGDAAPRPLGVLAGVVLFSADDPGSRGKELWRTTRTKSDFDGEGRADVVVYRPGSGQWWIDRSLGNFTSSVMVPWGVQAMGDQPVPADFDGDGKVDPAVFRPQSGGTSLWFVKRSSTNYADAFAVTWGTTGDQPVPGFYDADFRADPAVYRPATGHWFVNRSTTNYADGFAVQWGVAGDVPVPADYDGDNRTDIAVYRPSTGQWFIKLSDGDYAFSYVVQWGVTGDVPLPADYDGDGKGDPAVYRPDTGVLVRQPFERELHQRLFRAMGRAGVERSADAGRLRRRWQNRCGRVPRRDRPMVRRAVERRVRHLPRRPVGQPGAGRRADS